MLQKSQNLRQNLNTTMVQMEKEYQKRRNLSKSKPGGIPTNDSQKRIADVSKAHLVGQYILESNLNDGQGRANLDWRSSN